MKIFTWKKTLAAIVISALVCIPGAHTYAWCKKNQAVDVKVGTCNSNAHPIKLTVTNNSDYRITYTNVDVLAQLPNHSRVERESISDDEVIEPHHWLEKCWSSHGHDTAWQFKYNGSYSYFE